jgi:hypothetical protein
LDSIILEQGSRGDGEDGGDRGDGEDGGDRGDGEQLNQLKIKNAKLKIVRFNF